MTSICWFCALAGAGITTAAVIASGISPSAMRSGLVRIMTASGSDVDDSGDHTLPIRRVSGRRSLADDCAKHRVPMSGIARALVCGVSLCAMALLSAAAFAHTGSGTGGFVGGFEHPLFGPDHVAAMLAVGLWGAFLGPPAIWLLPIVFPL